MQEDMGLGIMALKVLDSGNMNLIFRSGLSNKGSQARGDSFLSLKERRTKLFCMSVLSSSETFLMPIDQ